MKLIPMQDFVLERRLFITNNDISESDLLAQIFLYAKFLKQPLKIEMFTPCNDEGKLLKEPEWWYRYQNGATPFMNSDEITPCQEYKKALEKVLFYGFEYQEAKQEDHYSLIRFPNKSITPLYPKLGMVKKQ